MRVVASQTEVPVVEQHLHVGEMSEAGVDTRSAGRSGIMHPPRPHRVGPQRAPAVVGHDGGFIVFCFFLPETNARRPPRPARGLRTWTSVASSRSFTPLARA